MVILHIYGAIAIFLLFCDRQDAEYESQEMEIGIAGPIFTSKNIKCLMGQQYPYPTKWEKNIVVIIHIYGAIAIFLLFCVHKDTGSESCEIEISVTGPIFAQKKIVKALWDSDIYTLKMGENNVIFLRINGTITIFLLFCDHQDTGSESCEIEMSIS